MMNLKFTKTKIGTLLLLLLLTFGKLYSQTYNGPVGINTTSPNLNSVLDVVSGGNNKGILIPRLTEAQRDAIAINTAKDDGLTIFNTTEDCYNYWSLADNEWKSVCGQIGKSVFTIDCSNSKAMGTYVQGKELTNSNYLSISVNVTKVGNYTISGTTTNGYNFYGTGVFLNTGAQTVQIPGQGTPTAVQLNTVSLSSNGVDVTCTPSITVNVLSAAGTYTMSCGSATVNGVYKVGTNLTASNTITLPVNVSALGSYTITTNTVDGISFSASGTFTATGTQNITLNGSGAPTSTTTKSMVITSDSKGGVSTTCSVNVVVVIPKKKLLAIGDAPDGCGYNVSGTSPSGQVLKAGANYGPLANSTVKYEGWDQVINGGGAPSAAQLTTWTTGANAVDIIVIGYIWGMGANEAQIIKNYLLKGGVVIAYSENNTGMQNLLSSVFDGSVNVGSVNTAGSIYKLPLTNDAILNGPFGDIRGLQWGEDASATTYATGLPASDITIYSGDTNISSATPSGTVGRVTAFRHNTLNFIWVGDGGFNSQCGTVAAPNTSDTICPFYADTNFKPIPKPNYGNGTKMNVYNSIFYANALAWGIKQAEFSGVNTH
ncbi:hypothetical protein EG344_10135 [Chryseobacterium sp. G0162]|uniref:hypothetical protein n=1 Tax=Chryseobacterium sp. G0162 TaxID=2487063 RepID=UPI000F4E0849|nr:hypothetical protein [Chryseobacterium sp. G0162]AZB09158.1 hypothetical protein EG344_10135 [Chryseobacterium sp. G0162]